MPHIELATLPPDQILAELVRQSGTQHAGAEIDVYLASGPVLRGRCISVLQGMATLHIGSSQEPSIAYVRVEQIAAITVLAASTRTPPPARRANSSDDVITPITPLTLAAVKAAMAEVDDGVKTLPDGIMVRPAAPIDRAVAHDDVSAAFNAMCVDASGTAIPAPEPIAEYDDVTPAEPLAPVEAPTFLPRAPRAQTPSNAGFDAMTFAMRKDTPRPRQRTPAPMRVDLMRQANTHAEMMSRVVGHRVDIAIAAPLDDDARRAIGHALPLVSDVVLAIMADAGHRFALDAVSSIELVAGDAEVRLDGTRLVVRCSLVDRFTAETLRAAIVRA